MSQYNTLSLSIPISLSIAALGSSYVTTPVSIQYPVESANTFNLDELYDIYVEPIKINAISILENKINTIKNLESNWDGYGADVPEENVIVNSLSFLKKLPEALIEEVKPDKILATPYGTIVIDIERKENLISIEIGENSIGFFSEFSDEVNFAIDKTSYNENHLPSELLAAFNKLYLQNI